jgi:hypothetical protein
MVLDAFAEHRERCIGKREHVRKHQLRWSALVTGVMTDGKVQLIQVFATPYKHLVGCRFVSALRTESSASSPCLL